MVDAVEKAGVPNTVWYNYRRVPAVTLAKQLIDDGRLGQDLPLPRQLPPGLDDLGRPAAGRHGPLAARRRRGRLGRHRRPAGPLHRHGPLAQRLDQLGLRHDRDLRQGAEAQPHRQGRAGRASTTPARSSAGSTTARSGLFESTRYARGHKALYTFEVNGEKASLKWDLEDLHRLEYFDHRDDSIVRGWRSIHVTDGDMPYMKHWWVPGPPDRLRAHVRPPGRRLPREPGQGRSRRPRPSATPWPPRPSATPCSTRPSTASGNRSCRCESPLHPPTLILRGIDHDKTGMNLLLWTTHVTEQHDAHPRPDQGDRLRRGRGADLRHGRPRAV